MWFCGELPTITMMFSSNKRGRLAIVLAFTLSIIIPSFVSAFSEQFRLNGARRPRLHAWMAMPIRPHVGLLQMSSSSQSQSDSEQSQFTSIVDSPYSFFDEASIYVRAGSGGAGSSTYKKAKKGQNGIPDGGAGGRGGKVILQLDDTLNTLAGLSKKTRLLSYRAENGKPGGRMYDNGRCGEDCIVRVPPGTVVSYETERPKLDEQGEVVEREKGEEIEYDVEELGSVTFDKPDLKVASGGSPGDGTAVRKSSGGGETRAGPTGGQRFRLRLTLKIVADVAIVGVPNAGKSTFLASVTRAKPRIADYPFTTVVPNLGVWVPGADYSNNAYDARRGSGQDRAAGSNGLVLCDVPGLIEGAAEGVGLGHAFLRHVERCRVILHLVDATSLDPVGDYKMVNEEIGKYGDNKLAKMPQVVVVNKIDAWGEESGNDVEYEELLREELEGKLKSVMPHSRLMWMSAKEREGVDDLMKRMSAYVKTVKEIDSSDSDAPATAGAETISETR